MEGDEERMGGRGKRQVVVGVKTRSTRPFPYRNFSQPTREHINRPVKQSRRSSWDINRLQQQTLQNFWCNFCYLLSVRRRRRRLTVIKGRKEGPVLTFCLIIRHFYYYHRKKSCFAPQKCYFMVFKNHYFYDRMGLKYFWLNYYLNKNFEFFLF